MKLLFRTIFVPFFAFLMLSASSLTAQEWTSGNRFMIHVGAGLPVGSFGQAYNLAADYTAALAQLQSGITTSIPAERTEIGNATLGVVGGITDLYKITPNLSLLGTLELAYNPFNGTDISNQYTALFRDPAFLQRLGLNPSSASTTAITFDPKLSIPARAYLNTSLLLGGRYDLPLSSAFSLYASAQAGLLYSIYPEYTTNLNFAISGTIAGSTPYSVRQTLEQNSTIRSMSAAAFAYKLGVGVLVSDRINIGVGYVAAQPQFGPSAVTADVKTSTSVTFAGMTMTTTPFVTSQTRDISTRTNLPIGLLSVSVGYLFGQ